MTDWWHPQADRGQSRTSATDRVVPSGQSNENRRSSAAVSRQQIHEHQPALESQPPWQGCRFSMLYFLQSPWAFFAIRTMLWLPNGKERFRDEPSRSVRKHFQHLPDSALTLLKSWTSWHFLSSLKRRSAPQPTACEPNRGKRM